MYRRLPNGVFYSEYTSLLVYVNHNGVSLVSLFLGLFVKDRIKFLPEKLSVSTGYYLDYRELLHPRTRDLLGSLRRPREPSSDVVLRSFVDDV